MCAPVHFDVTYAINPWMDPSRPVDRDRALRQWEDLRDTYRALGHEVLEMEPREGLPDLVFTANAGLVIGRDVLPAKFRHPERRAEEAVHGPWFEALPGARVHRPRFVNEGEGDFALVGGRILAAAGIRTDLGAHVDLRRAFGRPVTTLYLTDPRFYHLDTALCVLDDNEVAYLPEAFSWPSRRVLSQLYPDAVIATAADAGLLGLNAVSDGHHVVLPKGAHTLARALRARGYEPVPVDVSELRKAGGGPKCCTLELH
jgi:N-dimethylarginine dimethylaminohydrolase